MLSTFQCKMCKGVFEYARPEAEARAEYEEVFGALGCSVADIDTPGETDVVCDDCWQKIDPRKLAVA